MSRAPEKAHLDCAGICYEQSLLYGGNKPDLEGLLADGRNHKHRVLT